MKKIGKYLAIFFIFVVYAYIVDIDNIPSQVILMGDEELSINTLWGVKTVETSVTSNNSVNKTNVEIKLFGLATVKNISITSLEGYEVVPIRQGDRLKAIHKWCANCGDV